MRLRQKLACGLIFTFLFSSVGFTFPGNDERTVLKGLKVIATESIDVTGDKVPDKIYLVKDKRNDVATNNLDLVIKDGQTSSWIKVGMKDFSGDDGQLVLRDFTGDGVKDILVSVPAGKDSGPINARIISVRDSKPKTIFSTEDKKGLDLTAAFEDGFQARITGQGLSNAYLLDLASKKDTYLYLGVYNRQGKLLKKIVNSAPPFFALTPVDYDQDGVYELEGQQKMGGAVAEYPLATVKSLWKYSGGQWKTTKIQLSSSYQIKKNSVSIEYKLLKKVKENNYGQVYYPEMTNVSGISFAKKINESLAKAADSYLREASPTTKLSVDYTITRQSKDFLTVAFKVNKVTKQGNITKKYTGFDFYTFDLLTGKEYKSSPGKL